ncbi:hypothetical protein HPB47_018574 [Ixodes persulcatus]|uniref:Uncharacterized protein n=1 Tax=Ixodes persulcatus TaxID=34615 RepID=A0AC60QL78_IXOPE|nr:hypothetical protein HPB47_018574 [Ixodes persulcatus]
MIYLNGLLHQEKTITSVSDADDVWNCVDKLRLCAGVGESREFSVDIQGTSKHLFGTRLFSDRCMAVVTGKNFFTDFARIYNLCCFRAGEAKLRLASRMRALPLKEKWNAF